MGGTNPTPTKTGPDYSTGIVYAADGTVASYMPTHVLKSNIDGYEWGAAPTTASYHMPLQSPSQMQAVTKSYLDRFQLDLGNRYNDYNDFDYTKSRFNRGSNDNKLAWKFTSPFTGNSYYGVLPFYMFYNTSDASKQIYLFFLEIFNDYQAYRSYDVYNPTRDGAPYIGWPGVYPLSVAVYSSDSIPMEYQRILPKLVTYTDTQGGISTQKTDRVSFHFPLPATISNTSPTYPAKHFMYGTATRDVVVQPQPVAPTAYTTTTPIDGEKSLAVVKGAAPFVTTDANLAASKSTWTTMSSWQVFTNQIPLNLADGRNVDAYLSSSNASDGDSFLHRSKNGTGYLLGSKVPYEFWFSTFNQADPTVAKGQVNSACTYKSRYAVQAPGQENYSVANKLSWSGNPMTFVGVAWSGDEVVDPAGRNGVTGTKSAMTNGYGCVDLTSDYFANGPVCNSTNLPNNPNSVPNEFTGVLSVANANVLACTGLRQCPFVWHAREGFIRYHVFW